VIGCLPASFLSRCRKRRTRRPVGLLLPRHRSSPPGPQARVGRGNARPAR